MYTEYGKFLSTPCESRNVLRTLFYDMNRTDKQAPEWGPYVDPCHIQFCVLRKHVSGNLCFATCQEGRELVGSSSDQLSQKWHNDRCTPNLLSTFFAIQNLYISHTLMSLMLQE